MTRTKLVVESHTERCYGKSLKHFGDVMVFVNRLDRPGVKDILGDFQWRREHAVKFSSKYILEVIAAVLKERGLEIVNLKYSRKAGCSMCPCSPGYVGYRKSVNGSSRFCPARRLIIWLKEE